MSRPIAAAPYAKALSLLTGNPDGHAARLNELEIANQRLKDHPRLLEIIQDPSLSDENRKSMIERFVLDDKDPLLVNFFLLLTERRRIDNLSEIIRHYQRQVEASLGMLSVKISSAIPLDSAETESIKRQLLRAYPDKQLKITEEIDPLAIGGIAVEIDGRIVDGSLKTRLANLKKQLLALPV